MNARHQVPCFLAVGSLALLILSQVGCARSDAARFYLLTPTVPAAPKTSTSGQLGLQIERLPDYLRRPELATRRSPHEVVYDEFHRWASPLDESLPEALAQNLARIKGVPLIPLYPWSAAAKPERVIHVRIVRFDADATGKVILTACVGIDGNWREETIDLLAPSNQPDDIVPTQSKALAELARRMAGL